MSKHDLKDPIVVDPAGFDPKAGWKECEEWVEKHGGLGDTEFGPNYGAAAGADPGCMSCPSCHQMFWAWGRIAKCTECEFEFPTDWWSMYSWGVSAAHNKATGRKMFKHDEYIAHPYYRYGFENPVDDAWQAQDKLDWRTIMADQPAREIEKPKRQALSESQKKSINNTLAARVAIIEATDGKRGVAGAIPCPVCKTGQLSYTIASLNGHVWGRCSTENCVAWME